MHNICVFGCDPELKIEYTINESMFCVKCASDSPMLGQDSRIYADFSDESVFEVALFKKENDILFVDAKYSMSYLKTQNINLNKLAGFSVLLQNGELISASVNYYDNEYTDDKSVIRARELLEEIKSYTEPNSFIGNINAKIDSYKRVKIPVLTDFSWYLIDRDDEFFGLSAVSFFVNNINIRKIPWFFGRCKDNRLYAVLIKAQGDICLGSINDCIIKYSDTDTQSIYCAVGVMLLDDGQYFCRLA